MASLASNSAAADSHSSRQYCGTVNKWQRRTHGTRVVNCGASFPLAVARFEWRGQWGMGGIADKGVRGPKRGPPNKLLHRSRDGRSSREGRGGGGWRGGWSCSSCSPASARTVFSAMGVVEPVLIARLTGNNLIASLACVVDL